jgi:hypothetical protein
MSHSSAESARVVSVASGMQKTDRAAPARDHESSVDGVTWTPSVDVVLRKCG